MRLKQIALFVAISTVVYALIMASTPIHAEPRAPAQPNRVTIEESVCRDILMRAIDTLQGNCASLSRNSACYGNSNVEAVFASANPDEAHPQQAAGYRSLNTQFRSKLRGIRPTLD
jgi:hypothetical protein